MTQTSSPPPGRFRRATGWVRQRTDLKVILPIILTLGLLGYVSILAGGAESRGDIWLIVQRTWWVVLLLTVPYIAARAILWHELLEQLGIHVPWRPTLVALASGEIAKTIPGGIYVQNYVLARVADFGELPVVRSSTATTATLGLESALALPVALIIGVPDTPWLVWTLVGIVVAWLVLLAVLWLLVRYWEVHVAAGTPGWLRHVLLIADEFLESGAELFTWRTARAFVPTAVYMLVYVADLYLIAAAVGVHTISFLETMGIYAVVVLVVILVPLPTKLGTTELTGLTAFLAYGIPRPTAAIIMLGLRLLATGATMLLAAGLLVALRKEFLAPPPGRAPVLPDERADTGDGQ